MTSREREDLILKWLCWFVILCAVLAVFAHIMSVVVE